MGENRSAWGFVPLGIRLFVVRAETDKAIEGTLRKVHALGFREVEFAGYYGKSGAELAKLMKAIGFNPVSTHVGADDIAANPDSVIADAKALGLEYVICSSPMTRKPEKAKLEWAKNVGWVVAAHLDPFTRPILESAKTSAEYLSKITV